MTEKRYVIDLSTGKRIEAPEDYSPNLYIPGELIDPDHVEALRASGESEEVLRTLQSVGEPASYQVSPDSDKIPTDDPRFPWDLLERKMSSEGSEKIRTLRNEITAPPKVFTEEWWPFCYQGKPSGVKWNPPTSNGYGGQYYVKGTLGNVYLWFCGGWQVDHRGTSSWVCCGYKWSGWFPLWNQSDGPMKSWPKYTCK